MSLEEYEGQLADVEALLEATPDDPSLLSLKSDLEQLIAITRGSEEAGDDEEERTEEAPESTAAAPETADDEAAEPPKKKSKKLHDFQVPQHLIPLETDTPAERNRKRRAIKALKSKHKEEQKEIVAEKKQKSWQSFAKKKVKSKNIFSTKDG